jgi:hypothetical protein
LAHTELIRALMLDLNPPAHATPAFRASGDTLKRARAAADTGDAAATRDALVIDGVVPASADAFAKFLCTPHNFATLHAITAQAHGDATMQVTTVLSSAHAAWQMVEGADGKFLLSPTSRAELGKAIQFS